MMPATRMAACTSIGIALLVVAAPAAPRFAMVSLGTPSGYYSSFAKDINNLGQIVGAAVRDFDPVPVLWDSGGRTLLPVVAGGPHDGIAYAINDRGQIVGS